MKQMSGDFDCSIVMDASPLIAFLKIARCDLLAIFQFQLLCTDFVRSEITKQKSEFDKLIVDKKLAVVSVDQIQHLQEIETLRSRGLGRGEASSIVVAQSNSYLLLMDDKAARKIASSKGITLLSTADVIVKNIKDGVLTIEEADMLLNHWRNVGEHPVPMDLVSLTHLLKPIE